MNDRTVWEIPAEFIADSRAKYYAERDSAQDLGTYEEVYQSEYTYTLNDDYELKDWCWGNMDWDDVKDQAVFISQLPPKSPDYSTSWSNAHLEIIREK